MYNQPINQPKQSQICYNFYVCSWIEENQQKHVPVTPKLIFRLLKVCYQQNSFTKKNLRLVVLYIGLGSLPVFHIFFQLYFQTIFFSGLAFINGRVSKFGGRCRWWPRLVSDLAW
jgi:hypothetical protein